MIKTCANPPINGRKSSQCVGSKCNKSCRRLKISTIMHNPLGCYHYVRSQTAPHHKCRIGPRQQMNTANAFIDAERVYGSTSKESASRRTWKNGRRQKEYLSLLLPSGKIAQHGMSFETSFINPTMHSTELIVQIWTAQHNRLALELKAKYEILEDSNEFTKYYDININPCTLNAFAAAVGEFFLTMYGPSSVPAPISLHKAEAKVSKLMHTFKCRARILHGAVMRPYLRDFKTNILDEISQDDDIIDKAAVLIHRSRDHGIPGYTKFREYCGGEKVEDVDLIVLALAEKPVHGSLVGLTLGCVLASQYQKVQSDPNDLNTDTIA
ncbi:animal hem peroxidase [Necator americanus]|uniref:Animal hem peroxidase n=1 Tax=Necator americanus TaxID=51031 RepID=W2SGI9_NECAM|nr:animal hem peroxidase [Necator americanus]ETN68663.1 animal hem peroxidase [Necator americanus]